MNVPAFDGSLPDDDDRPFLEIALAAGAILITGDSRYFPVSADVEVLTPAEAVARIRSR